MVCGTRFFFVPGPTALPKTCPTPLSPRPLPSRLFPTLLQQHQSPPLPFINPLSPKKINLSTPRGLAARPPQHFSHTRPPTAVAHTNATALFFFLTKPPCFINSSAQRHPHFCPRFLARNTQNALFLYHAAPNFFLACGDRKRGCPRGCGNNDNSHAARVARGVSL